jgi:hypothetical protein
MENFKYLKTFETFEYTENVEKIDEGIIDNIFVLKPASKIAAVEAPKILNSPKITLDETQKAKLLKLKEDAESVGYNFKNEIAQPFLRIVNLYSGSNTSSGNSIGGGTTNSGNNDLTASVIKILDEVA